MTDVKKVMAYRVDGKLYASKEEAAMAASESDISELWDIVGRLVNKWFGADEGYGAESLFGIVNIKKALYLGLLLDAGNLHMALVKGRRLLHAKEEEPAKLLLRWLRTNEGLTETVVPESKKKLKQGHDDEEDEGDEPEVRSYDPSVLYRNHREWAEAEVEKLLALEPRAYSRKEINALQVSFARNWISIKKKYIRLTGKFLSNRKMWTEEETDFIRSAIKEGVRNSKVIADMRAKFGRTKHAVEGKLYELKEREA